MEIFQNLAVDYIITKLTILCLLLVLSIPGISHTRLPGTNFVDVTDEAEVDFTHFTGALGKRYMPETMGSGCAFFDFDHDGYLDILFANGREWRNDSQSSHTPKLYRNLGNGKFTDVTEKAGLAVPMYGMGVTIADFDNDDNQDIYFTNVGSNLLFRNNGNTTFTNVTDISNTGGDDWSTSALFFDYDRDGQLDLFVCNYVKWTIESDLSCTVDDQHRSYCTPAVYQGQSCRLYRNLGKGGIFQETTEKSGIYNPEGKSLGVTMLDYDDDGWIDLAVANDTEANFLYHNNGDGTFTDQALLMGIAFDENGKPRGCMGIDVADVNNDSSNVIAIGNFSNEMNSFFLARAGDYFSDQTIQTRIGNPSLFTLTFGLFFLDFDLDGYQDLFCANGHIEPNVSRYQRSIRYPQRPSLFWNQQNGKFDEIGLKVGLKKAGVGRGAAYGDYDRDGDLDLLVSNSGIIPRNGRAWLLRNDVNHQNNYLRIKTKGVDSNRDGIGTKVVISAAGVQQRQMVCTGSSYCSQSEMILTFGLGQAEVVDWLEVIWSSGTIDKYTNIAANILLTINEGESKKQ